MPLLPIVAFFHLSGGVATRVMKLEPLIQRYLFRVAAVVAAVGLWAALGCADEISLASGACVSPEQGR